MFYAISFVQLGLKCLGKDFIFEIFTTLYKFLTRETPFTPKMAKTNFGSKNVQEKYFDSKIAKNYCMARKRLMIFSSQKLAKILQAGKG